MGRGARYIRVIREFRPEKAYSGKWKMGDSVRSSEKSKRIV